MTLRILEEFYGLSEEKLHKKDDLIEVDEKRGNYLIKQGLAEEEVIPLAPKPKKRKTAE